MTLSLDALSRVGCKLGVQAWLESLQAEELASSHLAWTVGRNVTRPANRWDAGAGPARAGLAGCSARAAGGGVPTEPLGTDRNASRRPNRARCPYWRSTSWIP